MTTYCLGFAFDYRRNHVVLIRKNKPEWQKGLLNGVGGKIEDGESPDMAMAREFHEETGVGTFCTSWKKFTEIRFAGDVIVYCFVTQLPRGNDYLTQTTEEAVGWYGSDLRVNDKMIPNLRWLVPMALYALDNDDNGVPHTLDHE